MLKKEVKAELLEDGGIVMRLEDIPMMPPFCPVCNTPTLAQLCCSSLVFCTKCGRTFDIVLQEVDSEYQRGEIYGDGELAETVREIKKVVDKLHRSKTNDYAMSSDQA